MHARAGFDLEKQMHTVQTPMHSWKIHSLEYKEMSEMQQEKWNN